MVVCFMIVGQRVTVCDPDTIGRRARFSPVNSELLADLLHDMPRAWRPSDGDGERRHRDGREAVEDGGDRKSGRMGGVRPRVG